MSHDPQTETAFATYGDLGDIIYLCPSMSLVSAREGAPVTLFAKDGLRPVGSDHYPASPDRPALGEPAIHRGSPALPGRADRLSTPRSSGMLGTLLV